MRNIFVLSILGLTHSWPVEDITAPNCSLSRVGNWPSDRRDETLKWATNAGALGPHYRVFTKEEVKVVKTGQKYEFALTALSPDHRAQRFLIWTETKHEDHCGYGRLRSASVASELLSYSCPRFLVERSPDTRGHEVIPFTWEAPACGCSMISALVLDGDDAIFTPNDDPHLALSVMACVQDEGRKSKDPKDLGRSLQRKMLKTEGKRQCCSKGVQVGRLTNSDEETCERIPDDFLAETVGNYQAPAQRCAEIYKECCQNPDRMKKYQRKADDAKNMYDTFNQV